MILKTYWYLTLFYNIVSIIESALIKEHEVNSDCSPKNKAFSLVSLSHRSMQSLIYIDNVANLSDCIQLAIHYKGFAINYSLKGVSSSSNRDDVRSISRQHFWLQPQLYFNCHVLQCPENATFATLISDINFNYYSLYMPSQLELRNYFCLKEIGLFIIQTQPVDFSNATLQCTAVAAQCSQLADVSTLKRTTALSQYMRERNDANEILRSKERKIFLAYVNLHRTSIKPVNLLGSQRIIQSDGDLNREQFRAWAPGHPIANGSFSKDQSCVALHAVGTWITIDCKRQLSSICEMFP